MPRLLIALACLAYAAQAHSQQQVRAQLEALGQRDQAEVSRDDGGRPHVLAANVGELRQIVAEHGWPRISAVGREAARSAWLVAQHADFDRVFQREALALIEELAAAGEAEPKHVGYLTDRLAIGENRLQIYGTQGGCENGRWEPLPIEDPESVDVRRASLSMEPLSQYKAMGSALLCSEISQ